MGQPIGHIWDKTDTDTSKIDSAERQRKCGSINTHFWNAIHLTSLLIYIYFNNTSQRHCISN